MIEHKYIVVSAGERVEGVGETLLRERLAQALGPAAGRLVAPTAGNPAALRRFDTRESADQFLNALRQLGLVCWLRMLRPGESPELLLEQAADASVTPLPMPGPDSSARPAAFGRARLLAAAAAASLLLAVSAWVLWPRLPAHAAAMQAAPVESAAPPAAVAESAATPGTSTESSAAPAESAPPPAPAEKPQVSATPQLMVPEPVLVAAPQPKHIEPVATHAKRTDIRAAPVEPAARTAPPPAEAHAPGPAQVPPPATAAAPSKPPEPAQLLLASRQPVSPPSAADVIVPPSYDRSKVRQPSYPPQALRNGEQGEVRLLVMVGADGKLKKIGLRRSSGSTLLDRAAQDAVKNWRFKPGTRNGVPEESTGEVTIAFRLDEDQ